MNNVLIVIDKDDVQYIDIHSKNNIWNISWYITKYQNIYDKIKDLRKIISKNKIDFIMYSRNEHISSVKISTINKKLKIGYSSFSGIDKDVHHIQMQKCFRDFIHYPVQFNLKCRNFEPIIPESKKTYSLIFDMEQLGGVRFGLPRILKILDKYKIRATFFVTNLINMIYPHVIETLTTCGHEVGIHGLFHEDISIYPQKKQENLIRLMLDDLQRYKIYGANFVGRMNVYTIKELANLNLKYFIYPLKNTIKILSLPPKPRMLDNGLFMVPVSVETYNKDWKSIKNQIDNSVIDDNIHIVILMHPFFDGSRDRIKMLERIIKYMNEGEFQPVRLNNIIKEQSMNSFKMTIPFVLSNYNSGPFKYIITRAIQNISLKLYDRLKGKVALKVI